MRPKSLFTQLVNSVSFKFVEYGPSWPYQLTMFNSVLDITLRIVKHPSNKGQVISRLLSSYAYQVKKRLLPKYKWKYTLFNGAQIYIYNGCASCSSVVYFKLQDYEEINYLRRNIKVDDVILDIGANIGHFSLLLSDLNTRGKFLVFEPHPKTFLELKENFNLNPTVPCQLYNMALSNKSGVVQFSDGSESCQNSIVLHDNTQKSISVKSISLDDFISQNKIIKVDIIKIDVEGFEYSVFQGAQNLLLGLKPRIIVFENGTNTHDVIQFLSEFGYTVGIILDGHFTTDTDLALSQNLIAVKMENH